MSFSVFKLEYGNQNVDGQMHRETDRPTGTNTERNLDQVCIVSGIVLPIYPTTQSNVNRLAEASSSKSPVTKMLMDRQVDGWKQTTISRVCYT